MTILSGLSGTGGAIYTLKGLSEALGISLPSARVLGCRKVKRGELIRVRRDLYLLPQALERFEEKDSFLLANLIQTPSYVSFLTALSYYGLTTQILPSLVESANPVRSVTYRVRSITFRYFYCRPSRYFGFEKRDGFFIAAPEKALLDSLYLSSLGRYAIDGSALDLNGIRAPALERGLKMYPELFRRFYKRWRRDYEDSRTA